MVSSFFEIIWPLSLVKLGFRVSTVLPRRLRKTPSFIEMLFMNVTHTISLTI
jgi:hypothetical protein